MQKEKDCSHFQNQINYKSNELLKNKKQRVIVIKIRSKALHMQTHGGPT